MTWESWLTHWIGSVWSLSLPSTRMPPKKMTRLATTSGMAEALGRSPSFTTMLPSVSLRLERWRRVGDLYSRMPSEARGNRMLHRQMAAMPTARRAPNWRIIGTLAKYSAANAKMASKVTTSSAGHRLVAVSWMGCSAWLSTTSSSTRACIWMA